MKDTIAIARTGTFKDSQGRTHTFTKADLDAIAASYDPAREEAPLVKGHPSDNHPAFGWVKSVFRKGDRLFAQIAQVADQTRREVHDGLYKYVSMSLHPDGKRLRHVGLLGAVPPAIDGLGPVNLNDAQDMTFNFAAEDLEGGPNQGATMSAELQQRIGALEKELADLKAQLDNTAKERDQATSDAKDAATQRDATAAEFAAYRGKQEQAARISRMERLIEGGKVMPAEKKDLMAQVEALAMIPAPMEFSTGETMTAEERLWKSLEARQQHPMLFSAQPPAEFASAAGLGQQAAVAAMDYSKKV